MIRTSLAALALFAPVLALAQEPASETDFIRGVVRSTARVSIATDLAAPIVAMPLLDGERFSRGDVLVAFDCSRHAAQRRASEAAAQSASVELKQKSFLRKRGAAGQGEVDQARAGYARRQAENGVARA
ncbi:MAG TPA: hypothetical protein PKE65_09365, partial [Rhizobiaceae bacterium]|nr:hypothetical protein [Rhizobiaceae bacterium]